jgi:hypothetical protein
VNDGVGRVTLGREAASEVAGLRRRAVPADMGAGGSTADARLLELVELRPAWDQDEHAFGGLEPADDRAQNVALATFHSPSCCTA